MSTIRRRDFVEKSDDSIIIDIDALQKEAQKQEENVNKTAIELFRAIPVPRTRNIFAEIARENIPTLVNFSLKREGKAQEMKRYQTLGRLAVIRNKLDQALHPAPELKRRLILGALSDYEASTSLSLPEVLGNESSVIDSTTLKDLEILRGSLANIDSFLAQHLNHCATEAGLCMFYRMLTQPNCSMEDITRQQAIVRELVENQPLFDEINDILSELTLPENGIVSLLNPDDIFSYQSMYMRMHIFFENQYESIQNLSDKLNESALFREFLSKSGSLFDSMSQAMAVYAILNLSYNLVTGQDLFIFLGTSERFSYIPPLNLIGLASFLMRSVGSSGLTALLAITHYFNREWTVIDEWREGAVREECIRTKVCHIASYFSALDKISEIVDRHLEIPQLSVLSRKWKNLKTEPEMAAVLAKLQHSVFRDTEPRRISYYGTVMAAYYHLMKLNTALIGEAMAILGKMDAELSIAKIYKEATEERPFCFPEHREAAHPLVIARDFWTPLLARVENITLNSLTLGEKRPSNIVVTGPNAGGKSTAIRGLVQSILMAQSLGIAPARELVFTPFDQIITYLNITDDIAEGNSYFRACAARAGEIYDAVFSNKSNFSLVAIDEPFNGTDPEEGPETARKFLKALGKSPSTISITCTHFSSLSELAKKHPSLFKNYKVPVIELPDDELQFPYELQEGVSDQHITRKIVVEEMTKKGYSLLSFLRPKKS